MQVAYFALFFFSAKLSRFVLASDIVIFFLSLQGAFAIFARTLAFLWMLCEQL